MEARVQQAQHEEFEKLNQQQTLLNINDVDYMRWIHLHPDFTASQKRLLIENRCEQMEIKGKSGYTIKNQQTT